MDVTWAALRQQVAQLADAGGPVTDEDVGQFAWRAPRPREIDGRGDRSTSAVRSATRLGEVHRLRNQFHAHRGAAAVRRSMPTKTDGISFGPGPSGAENHLKSRPRRNQLSPNRRSFVAAIGASTLTERPGDDGRSG